MADAAGGAIPNPPGRFRTARLELRRPVVEDAAAVFAEYACDPEVSRYLTWAPHQTRDSVAEFLEGLIESIRAGDELAWVVTKAGTNWAIGMLDARIRGHRAELGYVLGQGHWGNGYMPEAVSTVAEWLLRQQSLFRVSATCDVENIASQRTLEKAQFDREGLLRRWIVLPNRSAEPRDCYIYGRVR